MREISEELRGIRIKHSEKREKIGFITYEKEIMEKYAPLLKNYPNLKVVSR